MPTLKQLRERAMLSQSELATLCGVGTQTISLWERGKITPRFKQQRALVQALHCTPDELFAALQHAKEAWEGREQKDNERPAA